MTAPGEYVLRRLRDGGPPLLLDGGTGAELPRRGIRTPPPLWSAWALVTSPTTLRSIAKDFAAAGAEILTANTFRSHWRNLRLGGLGDRTEELTAKAIALAREGAGAGAPGRVVAIAGSQAPLEDCYRPEWVPKDAVLASEHERQARALAAGGADLILVETMNTIRESVAATRAAVATGLPVFSCVVCREGAVLFSGERVADWTAALRPLGAAALGINCTRLGAIEEALAALAAAAPGVPLVAYANIGESEPVLGWDSSETPPERYTEAARGWIGLGARVVGGCCGVFADHIAALRAVAGPP
ncbi:MAG: homocysteine S-methyltransferase family protein [Planctomycetales bacterium]|nr:homocysteine S-methyltransferase family protein [Planctomycetales bacterium]